MDTDFIAGMQNLMGYFCQNIYLENYEKCEKLFADGPCVEFNLPDSKLYLRGKEKIAVHFAERKEMLRREGISKEILLYNTPAFQADNNIGRGSWDVFVFRCRKKESNGYENVEPSFARIDCDFVEQNGYIRIRRMDWYQLMNWLDWKCDENVETIFQPFEKRMHKTLEDKNVLDFKNLIDAENFVQIERLISRVSHTNRVNAEMLFANGTDTSFFLSSCMEKKVIGYSRICDALQKLDEMEKKNDNNPVCILYVTAPFICLAKNDQYASGTFVAMDFQVKGNAFGFDSQNPLVVRGIGLLDAEFVQQEGQWKIKSYLYNRKEQFEPIHRNLNGCKWKLAVEPIKNKKCAADIFEIQRLMLEWTERLKTGRLQEYPDLFMSSAKDEIVEWLSYDPERKCVGYEAIMKDLYRMDYNYATKNHYRAAIIHCAMTPLIEISEDGNYAYGQWLDLCYTDLSQITGDYKIPISAMMNACKYQHIYRKENGQWKLLQFTWGAFLALDQIQADPTTWKGWVTYSNIPWPMPFERYLLCENAKSENV